MAGPLPSLEQHSIHAARDGGHVASVTVVEIEAGSIQLEICDSCSYVESSCLHEKNSWNADGTVLRCRLCGFDVT